MPAKLRLDFLQKYCTLERALDLPRTAHLLEIAGKAVPLREKVRQEYGEPRDRAQPRDLFSMHLLPSAGKVATQQQHVAVLLVTTPCLFASTHNIRNGVPGASLSFFEHVPRI